MRSCSAAWASGGGCWRATTGSVASWLRWVACWLLMVVDVMAASRWRAATAAKISVGCVGCCGWLAAGQVSVLGHVLALLVADVSDGKLHEWLASVPPHRHRTAVVDLWHPSTPGSSQNLSSLGALFQGSFLSHANSPSFSPVMPVPLGRVMVSTVASRTVPSGGGNHVGSHWLAHSLIRGQDSLVQGMSTTPNTASKARCYTPAPGCVDGHVPLSTQAEEPKPTHRS
jgi:hypothetical protein